MLVLTRKVGEAILVGEATVTVTRIQGNVVRLGIVAPPDQTIRRIPTPILTVKRGGSATSDTTVRTDVRTDAP